MLNSTIKKQLTLNKNLFKFSNFYSVITKPKFRRDIQPGYSRYNWDDFGDTSNGFKNSRLTHKSNAEELICQVPPVEVEDNIAVCYGVYDFGWGHPVEFITLNTRHPETPSVCKYCGMRYVMKQHH